MSNRSLSAVMTVFLIFFGVSLLDSVRRGHWWVALFWVAMATVFYRCGLRAKPAPEH